LSLEQEYRSACAARNAASVAFDVASSRADFAYANRQRALGSYVSLVEQLAVEEGSLPSASQAAGPSQPRVPTKRKRGEASRPIPELVSGSLSQPRAVPSKKGKEKARLPFDDGLESDEGGSDAMEP
jgi:hypothetical protein